MEALTYARAHSSAAVVSTVTIKGVESGGLRGSACSLYSENGELCSGDQGVQSGGVEGFRMQSLQ